MSCGRWRQSVPVSCQCVAGLGVPLARQRLPQAAPHHRQRGCFPAGAWRSRCCCRPRCHPCCWLHLAAFAGRDAWWNSWAMRGLMHRRRQCQLASAWGRWALESCCSASSGPPESCPARELPLQLPLPGHRSCVQQAACGCQRACRPPALHWQPAPSPHLCACPLLLLPPPPWCAAAPPSGASDPGPSASSRGVPHARRHRQHHYRHRSRRCRHHQRHCTSRYKAPPSHTPGRSCRAVPRSRLDRAPLWRAGARRPRTTSSARAATAVWQQAHLRSGKRNRVS